MSFKRLQGVFLFGFICFAVTSVAAEPGNNPDIKFSPVTVFALANKGSDIELSTSVDIEQKNGDGWKKIVSGDLMASGDSLKCIYLDTNSTVTLGPWNGMLCPGPNCDANGPAPDGTYRYVVNACDGTRTFVSPAFEKKWDMSK